MCMLCCWKLPMIVMSLSPTKISICTARYPSPCSKCSTKLGVGGGVLAHRGRCIHYKKKIHKRYIYKCLKTLKIYIFACAAGHSISLAKKYFCGLYKKKIKRIQDVLMVASLSEKYGVPCRHNVPCAAARQRILCRA
jgi:hypothetical protein